MTVTPDKTMSSTLTNVTLNLSMLGSPQPE